jgi:hypothetical protein
LDFLFFEDPDASLLGRWFSFAMVGVILLSIVNFLCTSIEYFWVHHSLNEGCMKLVHDLRPITPDDCLPATKNYLEQVSSEFVVSS